MEGREGMFTMHGAQNKLSAPDAQEPTLLRQSARMEELETENARLKSLVGELLVANQRLREKISA
jgi:hypothetical protein